MIFGVGQISGDIYIYPQPTFVAMAMKYGTKLAITRLVLEISARCFASVGEFLEMGHSLKIVSFYIYHYESWATENV